MRSQRTNSRRRDTKLVNSSTDIINSSRRTYAPYTSRGDAEIARTDILGVALLSEVLRNKWPIGWDFPLLTATTVTGTRCDEQHACVSLRLLYSPTPKPEHMFYYCVCECPFFFCPSCTYCLLAMESSYPNRPTSTCGHHLIPVRVTSDALKVSESGLEDLLVDILKK